jgi:hypothetical protein
MAASDSSDELLESMTSAGARMPASHKLRDAVLSRTTRTIRFRRRMRRASLAATLVACYLGGVATVSLWPAANSVERFNPGAAVGLAPNGEPGTSANGQKLIRPEDDQIADGSLPPAAARLTPYERMCRTGNQQLEEHDDILAATRSYKKALQLASSDQRGIAPDHDTWLLMALKQSTN